VNASGPKEQVHHHEGAGVAAVNGFPERLSLSLEAQLLEQCSTVEDGIAAVAMTVPSEIMEAFAEHAIEEVLVVFAQHTRGPGAAKLYMALSAHLRDGVRRRLDELDSRCP
jgi:hypothetical protein